MNQTSWSDEDYSIDGSMLDLMLMLNTFILFNARFLIMYCLVEKEEC